MECERMSLARDIRFLFDVIETAGPSAGSVLTKCLFPVITLTFEPVNNYFMILIDQLHHNVGIVVCDPVICDDIADVVGVP
jgi:hypothetical protein